MSPRSPSRRSRSDDVIDVDMPEVSSSRRAPPRAEPASSPDETLRAPGALLLALEGRAPWEFAASIVATPWLRRLPKGDAHRVLVFPGLAANDLTTLPMRTFLRDRGYTPERRGTRA